MTKAFLSRIAVCCAVAVVATFAATPAGFAQTVYFWRSPEATNGFWSGGSVSGANWWRGFAETPTGNERLIIDNNNILVQTNDLANTSRFQIIFTNNIASHTIDGTITNSFFDFGGVAPKIENYSFSNQTVNFPIRVGNNIGGGLQLNPVNGDLTIGGTIDNNGNDVVVYSGNQGVGAGRFLNLTGSVFGTGKLIINADARVRLSGSGLYSGNTEINRGEFWLATNSAGVNGTLATNSTIFVGNGGQVADTAKLWIEAAGGVISNAIVVNQGNIGTRVVGGLNASGTNTYTGGISVNSGNGVNLEAQTNGATRFNGVITGSGGITKVGAGTVVLANNNTYTGITTVSAGILQIGAGGGAGMVGTNQVVNNATIVFNRGGNSATYSGGTISGTGRVTVAGSAPIYIITNNTFSGGATLAENATVRVGVNSSFSGTTITGGALGVGSLTLSNGATLASSGGNTVLFTNVQLRGNANIGVIAGSTNWSGRIVLGSPVIDLGGSDRSLSIARTTTVNNLGSGLEALQFQTNVAGGVVRVQGGSLALTTTNSGSWYSLVGVRSTMEFTNNGKLIIGDHVIVNAAVSASFSTVASNQVALVVNEGGILNTGDGGVNSRSVTLYSLAGTGTVQNLATAAGQSVVTLGAGSADFAGTLANGSLGSIALTKNGAGSTQILSGANTYTGLTTITAGMLQLGNGGTNGSLGDTVVNNNAMLGFNRSDSFAFTNAVTGSGSIWQLGSGTTVLSGTNISSGPATIVNGTLQVGNGGTSGQLSAGVVTNNGTLAFNRSGVFTNGSGIISGTGRVVHASAGVLQLNNANTYGGGTIVTNGGAVHIGNNSALGTGVVTLAGSGIAAANGIRTIANAINLAGDASVGGAGFDLAFSGPVNVSSGSRTVTYSNSTTWNGVIGGSGSLAFSAASPVTVTLANTNTFSGGAIVNSNAIIRITSAGSSVTNTTTILGGALGTGTLTLNDGATIAPAGGITLIQSGVTVNGNVNIGISNQTARLILSSDIDLAGGDRTFNIARSTTLAALASGLEGLRLDGAFQRSYAIVANGSLVTATTNTGANFAIYRQNGTIRFTNNAGLVIGDHIVTTFGSGVPFGSGINAPAVTVNSGGIFNASDGSGVSRALNVHSLAGQGSVINLATAAGTGTITIGSGTANFSGAISDGPSGGIIALVKNGAGSTQTLSGVNTYTGPTLVNAGTLAVNGSIVSSVLVSNGGYLAGTGTVGATIIDNGGHLAPGTSPGVLTVTNSLTLNPTSQLDYEIGAITNARSYYDAVQVVGTPGDLVLDGVLNISNWAGGFGATSGTNVYALFDYSGSLTDNTVELGNVPTNLGYRVQTDVPGHVDLSVKEFAQGSFTNSLIATSLLLDFGSTAQSFSSNLLAFSIFSFDTNAVRLALSLTNFDGAFGPFSIAGANFAGLGAGSNQLFSAIMDLSTVGVFSNSFSFALTSGADGYLFSGDPSHLLTLTLIGEVTLIPEPGAAAALLALAGFLPRRRRR